MDRKPNSTDNYFRICRKNDFLLLDLSISMNTVRNGSANVEKDKKPDPGRDQALLTNQLLPAIFLAT